MPRLFWKSTRTCCRFRKARSSTTRTRKHPWKCRIPKARKANGNSPLTSGFPTAPRPNCCPASRKAIRLCCSKDIIRSQVTGLRSQENQPGIWGETSSIRGSRFHMMKHNILRHQAARTLAFVVISSLTGFASVVGTFDRSFQVNGPVDLEVLTRSGDITVRSGASGTVSIHAKIHSGNSWFGGDTKPEVQELQNNPPIRQNGNSIRIDYVNLRNVSVDYEITAPEDTTLRAHTGSGDQTIEGLRGNTDLESGSG